MRFGEVTNLFRSQSVHLSKYALILAVISIGAMSQTSAPMLYYSSAKTGPNHGWENSATKGASITVWAKNVGTSRGSNYVSVAGVNLTSATDYAEWGATTNPRTAKGFQRITFWLNSSMRVGNTSGISVTVSGVTSNVLPFAIDNTGVIRFIDQDNGNDSWDGQYSDHSRGGSHGPWKTPFMYLKRRGVTLGTFFYLRGRTYTAIFEPGSGHPALAYIGYFEQNPSGQPICKTPPCGCRSDSFYPPIDGTDVLRYTVTSYPGEVATFYNVALYNLSSYWTFTNFRWQSPTATFGNSLTLGGQWAMCADCQRPSYGLDVIGMEFSNGHHHAIQTFGHNFRLLANYFNTIPIPGDGYGADTAYPLYLAAGNRRLVKDNEIHGGAMYPIHNFDEYRCNARNDINREMHDHTFDSNLIDLTRDATSPQVQRAAILTGLGITGTTLYTNFVAQNNVIYSRDSLVSEAAIKLAGSGSTTQNGVHIYNNTIHLPSVPWGVFVFFDTSTHWQNVDVINNIFSGIRSYEIYVDGSTDVHPTFQYNLVSQTPRIHGKAAVSSNVVGVPAFIDTLISDFHLESSSAAINAGTDSVSNVVTKDHDGVGRPQDSKYDIGAYEYLRWNSTVSSH